MNFYVRLFMRINITCIFLFSFLLQVSASSLAQNITLSKKNITISQLFSVIKTQSGFDFLYEPNVLAQVKRIDINVRNASINQVLDLAFTGQPLTYTIEQRTIVVSKKEQNVLDKIISAIKLSDLGSQKSGYVVAGKVTDETDRGLPGVTVRVKNGSQAVITNDAGMYAIGVANPNSVLEFSYLGYKTEETVVNTAANVNIKMIPDPAKLDEVIVIAYGTTTRRLNTGSQVGISAKDIAKQPVTNIAQTMQGRLAGVTVVQNNGLPGAGITIQVRGVTSISNNSLPFYVIDGVPFMNTSVAAQASSTGTGVQSAEGNTSPLNILNPADIENIEVLKDADATAIYGSRGANGVVLITTKKGRAGKTEFNINASSGMSKVGHFVDMLSTEEYLALRRTGFANNGTTPSTVSDPDLTVWDQTANTNFPKLLLGNTARTYDVTSNISGGDVRTNFYLSGTYHKESNVYPGSQAYNRGGGNLSINHSSIDGKFTLGLSANYSADKNNIATTELATYAYSLAPNFPLYRPDGSLYWASGTSFNNPLAYLNQTNDSRASNFITNLNLKYNLAKGLDFKSLVGYGRTDSRTVTIRPLTSLNPDYVIDNSGTASQSYTFVNNYIFEPQLNYKSKIWKGNLDLLAGGSWQYNKANTPYSIGGSGFASDDFLTNIASARTISITNSSQEYKYVSVFGRANYNLSGKYILNVSFRRDGSSKFGADSRFGNFGAGGAAWIFSEEKLVKDNLPWLSFGKLRGSYGIVGSDAIGNYGYLDSYASSSYVYNGVTGFQPTRLANSSYQWESTRKIEVGLELGFLKDRLSLTSSYYRNRTSNQLLQEPLSAQSGFSAFQSNLPALVQNSGLEFQLNSTNIRNKDFSWTSSFNISKNRNKLVAFPGLEKAANYAAQYIVGNPISSFYVYQYTGIDAATGLPSFRDYNNNGTITSGLAATGVGDRVYAGTAYPDYFGGLTNSMTYKGLTLDFTFQFVKQKGRSLLASSFYPPGMPYNLAASVVDDYLALGSAAQLVTASARGVGRNAYLAYTNYSGSDANIVDASFIRMKNVSLSYNLPAKWVPQIKNVRLYLQGQNLFTITGYEGFDPESQGVVTPPLRSIVAGLQCTF
jgi:TonB-linked SusC/RagA family outer membrane protein